MQSFDGVADANNIDTMWNWHKAHIQCNIPLPNFILFLCLLQWWYVLQIWSMEYCHKTIIISPGFQHTFEGFQPQWNRRPFNHTRAYQRMINVITNSWKINNLKFEPIILDPLENHSIHIAIFKKTKTFQCTLFRRSYWELF